MKDICIIICNYNGKEYLVNCIKSLQNQTIDNFDICVVDNGSTDGSKDLLENQFGSYIHIIRNEENLGGAGGFETGIQYALMKEYSYITLLDNDIFVAEDTIEKLYLELKNNKDVGIIGANILYMDKPKTIMWYGLEIDFKGFTFRLKNDGVNTDNPELPNKIECDYIPACTAMTTRKVLLECGTMPVDNFIYNDDAELCYRMKKRGYKVLMLKDAVSYHKGGGSSKRSTTFGMYYGKRNALQFFGKYVPEKNIECYIQYILDDVFDTLFGCFYKGKKEIFQVTWRAFDDFIHGIRGKAGEGRILDITPESFEKITNAVIGCNKVYLQADSKTDGYERAMRRIKEKLKEAKPDIEILEINLNETVEDEQVVVFVHCEHVKKVKENRLPFIYFDQWLNIIANEEDFLYFQTYESRKQMFEQMYRPMLEERIHIIRSEQR